MVVRFKMEGEMNVSGMQECKSVIVPKIFISGVSLLVKKSRNRSDVQYFEINFRLSSCSILSNKVVHLITIYLKTNNNAVLLTCFKCNFIRPS